MTNCFQKVAKELESLTWTGGRLYKGRITAKSFSGKHQGEEEKRQLQEQGDHPHQPDSLQDTLPLNYMLTHAYNIFVSHVRHGVSVKK